MDFPICITSLAPEIRRSSNKIYNPVRFEETNYIFWNMCKAAMYLPILDEALSLVTKWKFLFEEKDTSLFLILYLISYEMQGTYI